MSYNTTLLELARWRLREQFEKQSFIPPGGGDPSQGGGDPSAGGAPPMDPSAGGGAPPMDPSMGGGAPPMDPSAGGGAPPEAPPDPAAGGGGSPDIMAMLQAMQQQISQMQQGGGGGAAPGGAPGAGMGGKPMKADINTVAMDIFQVKKMITSLFNMYNIPLPPDVIDGPNRDPSSGTAVPPGTPGSTSDVSNQSPPPGGGQGGQGAIPAIQPMPPAMPGGGEKQSSDLFNIGGDVSFTSIKNRAAALTKLAQSLRSKNENI